jgi:hypothetical protein
MGAENTLRPSRSSAVHLMKVFKGPVRRANGIDHNLPQPLSAVRDARNQAEFLRRGK